MPEKKKSVDKAKQKKVDKYDITVGLDLSFEDAIKKIATDANTKMKQKNIPKP